MKKVLIILMVFYANIAFSQKANPWSLEIGASTYNYIFVDNNNSNKFNYEFYILPSKSFSWIKLTTGIMYSTKRINRDETVDYDIKYIKLPILASVGYSFKRVKLSFTGGFIFDHILNYRVKLNYNYDGKNYKDYKFDDVNVAVRGGITISTKISKNINMTIQPFIDYKIVHDDIDLLYNYRFGSTSDYDYYYSQIPNGLKWPVGYYAGGLLSYGLSIGLEYVFK
ncbi:MAG: hypothetical protein PHG98_04370 [Bacteroidales bacterium]|nr:hypothetical protein [Bacilli bacterium]MDD4739166.1 hypothetical protein [Bacteroidales bacterium]